MNGDHVTTARCCGHHTAARQRVNFSPYFVTKGKEDTWDSTPKTV